MTITYIFFYRACKAQGVDRKTFSYTGWFQPYSVSNIGLRIHDTNKLTIYQAYIGLGWMIFIILFYGYASFRPWSVENFFIYYTMLILGKFQYPDGRTRGRSDLGAPRHRCLRGDLLRPTRQLLA
jgi:amino acid transporter